MNRCVRKPTIRVPTRSDTTRGVQSQKMVRGWKFWIKKVEMYYPCSETKVLISFAVTAKLILRLCFRLCRLFVFPCGGSYVIRRGLHSITGENAGP